MQNRNMIGVLGGLGPWATEEFLRMVFEETVANCDQDTPTIALLLTRQQSHLGVRNWRYLKDSPPTHLLAHLTPQLHRRSRQKNKQNHYF